jgi:hypothetical protein
MHAPPTDRVATDVLAVKDAVGVLLRAEQSAASIYERVLGVVGERAPCALREIQAAHLIAAHQLCARIDNVRLDPLDPEVDVDVTMEFVELMLELAAGQSRSPALEVLRQVERGSIDDYECAVAEGVIGPRLELFVTTRLLPACQRNLAALERMLAKRAA